MTQQPAEPTATDDLEAVLATTASVVDAVGADDWTRPTPCRDFDVAALVGATAPVGSAPGEKDVAVHGFAPARAVGDACSVDVVLYGEDRLRVRSWDGADLLHALSLVSSTWSTRPVVCLLDVDARSTASLVRWEGTLVRMVRSSRDA